MPKSYDRAKYNQEAQNVPTAVTPPLQCIPLPVVSEVAKFEIIISNKIITSKS